MNKTEFKAEPGKQSVVMTRVFDAPREQVYKLYTDQAMIPEWWGPKELTTTVDKMDPKKGGSWRYVQRDKDGNEYAFNGVYHEVTPERMVYTFEYEGMPGHVILETAKFEDMDGKTKMTVTDVFESVEDRDGMSTSGMEKGAVESQDRFEELLGSQRVE